MITLEQIKTKSIDAFILIMDKINKTREKIISSREKQEEMDQLLENLKIVQNELNIANTNYEFAKESELIDYYTYYIKATQIKYDYLLKQIKESGKQMCSEDLYHFVFVKNQDTYNNGNVR
jgi:hypothetical protein